MRSLVRIVAALASVALVLVMQPGSPAFAKGCQPACTRVEVVRPSDPAPPVVPLCWSTDSCWRRAPSGVFSAGEGLTVRVFRTDDDGRRRFPPPNEAGDPGFSVFFWRTTADSLMTVGAFEFAANPQLPMIEVPVMPRGETLVGGVQLSQPGFWIVQVRPRGAWPRTPWGTDPIVVQVQPPSAALPVGRALPAGWPVWSPVALGSLLLIGLFALRRAQH